MQHSHNSCNSTKLTQHVGATHVPRCPSFMNKFPYIHFLTKQKFKRYEFMLQWRCHPSFVTADLFHIWKECSNWHIGYASVKLQNNRTNTVFCIVFQLLWTVWKCFVFFMKPSMIWKPATKLLFSHSQTLLLKKYAVYASLSFNMTEAECRHNFVFLMERSKALQFIIFIHFNCDWGRKPPLKENRVKRRWLAKQR